MNANADPNALVQRFRPLYRLHSEEMWYPCHPEDQLRCANLVSMSDGAIVIPAGSDADQFLCTPAGLDKLARRGVHLDAATIAELQWANVPGNPRYAYFRPSSKYVIARAEDGLFPPYGWLAGNTWFHRGAPNNPLVWLGGDPASYARAALDSPHGAWQEPVTSAWVQTHTVAGVAYVDLIYTAFLAWNGSISLLAGQGEHPNDVETTIVRLRADDLEHPVRFYFQQHGGFAWYDTAEVERTGDRVVVYLARQSHECYPHPGRYTRVYGFADDLCDAGLTWDAPVVYTNRPQMDALRCTLAAGGDPNDIVLVPLDDPGPLWQYVRFQFLGRRPASEPLSNDDFLYQPFPLSTSKWWPEEGPVLGNKAGERSAPGVPDSFFDNVAAYLGPNPKPQCSSSKEGGRPARQADGTSALLQPTRDLRTVTGASIGVALAPNAPFVDWRGGIGSYLLGSVNAHLPGWIALLPDPLALENVSITGLRALSVTPAAATSATTATTSATTSGLDATGTINGITFTAHIYNVAVNATATIITPVAIPATTPDQWYVPYVGPAPYSYANPPWSTTTAINSGTVTALTIAFDTITVDTGSPTRDLEIDVLLATLRQTIEGEAANALKNAVNGLLKSLYEGTRRVG